MEMGHSLHPKDNGTAGFPTFGQSGDPQGTLVITSDCGTGRALVVAESGSCTCVAPVALPNTTVHCNVQHSYPRSFLGFISCRRPHHGNQQYWLCQLIGCVKDLLWRMIDDI
jgi:hypothetical protein